MYTAIILIVALFLSIVVSIGLAILFTDWLKSLR